MRSPNSGLRTSGRLTGLSEFHADGGREGDMRLKTEASSRNVVIHADLIAAGFAALRERTGERVFPDLPLPRDSELAKSHEVSKWFARHLDALDLKAPSLVLHGLRHGFREACDRGGVPADIRKVMGGWASQEVADRYGRRDQLQVLKREIAKLDRGASG